MRAKTKKSISDSLETKPSLLSHMPFLLQDLWALGGSLPHIISAVSALKIASPKTRVLDLGCGKGAVAIQIASKFGFYITGIDTMKPFLRDAQLKAAEYGVSHLCEFVRQDILEYVSRKHDFDMVILASLGGIFGSFRNTVTKLRRQVKSGGYMMIDDGYVKQDPLLLRKGYNHYKIHEETLEELTAFGDYLVTEINTRDFSEKINAEYLKVIEKRGKELMKSYPELQSDLSDYIRTQVEEYAFINEYIEGALWVLQKKRRDPATNIQKPVSRGADEGRRQDAEGSRSAE